MTDHLLELPDVASIMVIALNPDIEYTPQVAKRISVTLSERLDDYCKQHGKPTPFVIVSIEGERIAGPEPITLEQIVNLLPPLTEESNQ